MIARRRLCWTAAACAAALALAARAPAQEHPAHGHPRGEATALEVPASLQRDHDELHAKMREAAETGGATGEAARALAAALRPHFEKENAYALPPLSLLPALGQGRPPAADEREEAVRMTARLRADLAEHLAEHREIAAAAERMRAAAEREGKPEQARLAESIRLHAQVEEEVLYPAALLVGEYLRRTGPGAATAPSTAPPPAA